MPSPSNQESRGPARPGIGSGRGACTLPAHSMSRRIRMSAPTPRHPHRDGDRRRALVRAAGAPSTIPSRIHPHPHPPLSLVSAAPTAAQAHPHHRRGPRKAASARPQARAFLLLAARFTSHHWSRSSHLIRSHPRYPSAIILHARAWPAAQTAAARSTRARSALLCRQALPSCKVLSDRRGAPSEADARAARLTIAISAALVGYTRSHRHRAHYRIMTTCHPRHLTSLTMPLSSCDAHITNPTSPMHPRSGSARRPRAGVRRAAVYRSAAVRVATRVAAESRHGHHRRNFIF